MLDIQQKRKLRAVMYHRATLVVLAIIVVLVLHSTWVVYEKKSSSEAMKKIVSEHVSELRQRKTDLDEKIDKLATVSGVEEEIRSKFGVAKDNESMVVVIPKEDKYISTTTQEVSFWSRLKGILGLK